jgi:hypothetical protein
MWRTRSENRAFAPSKMSAPASLGDSGQTIRPLRNRAHGRPVQPTIFHFSNSRRDQIFLTPVPGKFSGSSAVTDSFCRHPRLFGELPVDSCYSGLHAPRVEHRQARRQPAPHFDRKPDVDDPNHGAGQGLECLNSMGRPAFSPHHLAQEMSTSFGLMVTLPDDEQSRRSHKSRALCGSAQSTFP